MSRVPARKEKAPPLQAFPAPRYGKRWPGSQDESVMKRKTAHAATRSAASKPLTVSVTIETPRGSRNKIKYEPAKKMYSLSKILPEGMVFPYDFGFVPGTKAE